MPDKISHGSWEHNAAFRRQLTGGEILFGTFVKTPHPAIVEVLGATALDFLVLDAEHAPFDRASIDLCVLAGLAAQCPVLVRIPAAREEWVMASLDAGAAGILAPRVSTVEQAQDLARMTRYQNGERGFSPSPRAGEYGARTIETQLALGPQETVLVCQIEDRAGVDAAGEIAAVDGVDALFVGPVDLAVSIGSHDAGDDRVAALCRETLLAAPPQARSGLFVGDAHTARKWTDHGASLFIVGTDQALLKQGAVTALKTSS